MIRQRTPSDFDDGLESQFTHRSGTVFGSRISRIGANLAFRWRFLLIILGIIVFLWGFTSLMNFNHLETLDITLSALYPGDLPTPLVKDLGSSVMVLGSGRNQPRSNLGNTALVFLAHDRPEYLRQCLTSVFALNGLERVDLIVSMDEESNFAMLREVVEEFATKEHPILLWDNRIPKDGRSHSTVDHITTHHRQVFDRLFFGSPTGDALGGVEYDYGIVLETDLTVSIDFLDYMFTTGHLLHPSSESSKSLFCVSAWNDNGFSKFDLKEDRLFRTDFYPGLGWMIHKSIWKNVLSSQWPSSVANTNYDWWIRSNSSVRKMDCIVPEVPRTHHVAKYGSHVNGETSYNFYTGMLFASGTVPISAAEAALVGDLVAYEARIKQEHFTGAKVLEKLPSPFTIPHGENVILICNDDNTWADNAIAKCNEAIGAWNEFRGRHKGLLSLSFGPGHGHTNITLVTESMRSYWEL